MYIHPHIYYNYGIICTTEDGVYEKREKVEHYENCFREDFESGCNAIE